MKGLLRHFTVLLLQLLLLMPMLSSCDLSINGGGGSIDSDIIENG